MGRSILAVLAGFVVGNLAITLGHALQRVIYPPPPGFNFEDPEQVRALFEAMTAGGYALLLATYAVSCALGAFTAAKVATRRPQLHALIIGALFTIGGIVNQVLIAHPLWET
ncbi:MAG: hypothetical protein KC636_22875, partial [Myxococcales bacterium]|nr:hypothetical protein [Myxococcales bacterium]